MNYSDYVSTLRKELQNRIFLNSDDEKRKTVYLELIQSASHNLRFFAGNLCDDITNSEEFVERISDFIEKGGELGIILNQYDEALIKDSDLYKRLAFYAARKYNVHVNRTSAIVNVKIKDEETPTHFAVADNSAYRLEIDIHKRTAICNMNDEIFSQKLVDLYEQILSDHRTEPINLVTLFSLKPKE